MDENRHNPIDKWKFYYSEWVLKNTYIFIKPHDVFGNV